MASTEDSGKPRGGELLGLPSWVWLASAIALLVVGWAFILFTNNFHFTAPVVFVCLGYGAGVAAVYTLFRTGSSAVSGGEDDDEGSWGRPLGARAELEREKRALVKAIKEAEFDLEMGKLSAADAEAMIARYRAQAIEVIKEIDRKGGDATTREQIEREVRARLEVAKARKGGDDKRAAAQGAGGKGKGKKQTAAQRQAAAIKATSETKAEATAVEPSEAAEAVEADEVEAKTASTASTAAEASEASGEGADGAEVRAPAAADATADNAEVRAPAAAAGAATAEEATP